MEIIIYVLVGVCFVAAIVLFISNAPAKHKSRDSYLAELTKFVDGRIEKIEGSDNDFRITFRLHDKELFFEDSHVIGFSGQVNHGFLKINTRSKYTLSFSERKRKTRIKGDIVLASQVSSMGQKDSETRVKVPASLQEYEVHTNDVFATNQLLNDPKVCRILTEFKNVDQRGYPFMALKVIDGTLMFQFQTSSRYKPSLMSLMDNIALIEDYAAKAVVIANKIEQIALSDY